MSKVSISELAKTEVVSDSEAFAGSSETRAFFKPGKDPIQVYFNRLESGGKMRIGPSDDDSITYVWEGTVEVAGQTLPTGSSFIVERGASSEVRNGNAPSQLLTFYGNEASERGSESRIRLLPRQRVPFAQDLGHDNRVSGGMHADAAPPTNIWLHENSFPPPTEAAPPDAEAGVHCHSEDEVIFVIDGQIRLGQKLYEPGTAVGIAANTFYSFTPGPAGLKFINFRPAQPSEIRMRNGLSIDEVAYWRDRLPRPEYITLEAGAEVGV